MLESHFYKPPLWPTCISRLPTNVAQFPLCLLAGRIAEAVVRGAVQRTVGQARYVLLLSKPFPNHLIRMAELVSNLPSVVSDGAKD